MKEYTVLKMYSKELKREMRMFISLPKSYYNSNKRYPVLYMCDGQNLFDDLQATYGKSWGILETYKTQPDLPELIIVGIESNDDRSNELVPFKFQFTIGGKLWGGKTDAFLLFIINTLKTYIDKRYRSLKKPENTAIMGSSFGGVCATYAALKYGDYFTKFGCVSNAYFPVQEEMVKLAKIANLSNLGKIYMDVGTKESKNLKENTSYLESNEEIYNILKTKIVPKNIRYNIVKDAVHNESAWELRFAEIINFLFEQ